MINVNGFMVPSCAELARLLKEYGDTPLFSGSGWYVITGFNQSTGGTQIMVSPCPPIGHVAKDSRNATIGGE